MGSFFSSVLCSHLHYFSSPPLLAGICQVRSMLYHLCRAYFFPTHCARLLLPSCPSAPALTVANISSVNSCAVRAILFFGTHLASSLPSHFALPLYIRGDDPAPLCLAAGGNVRGLYNVAGMATLRRNCLEVHRLDCTRGVLTSAFLFFFFRFLTRPIPHKLQPGRSTWIYNWGFCPAVR